MTTYGYARISTKEQSIERQERNIKRAFPDAVIVKEAYTGTKINRPEFSKILKIVKKGDTIVFDSVSRMSRNAEEGMNLYEDLFNKGVNLVFLKEPQINTEVYKKTLDNHVQLTGTCVDYILKGVNEYMIALAREQVRIAFNQAQKEVDDLHQRTSEGMMTAKLNGKQIGQKKGAKLHVKKSDESKRIILKHSRDFGGTLSDAETIKLAGISRNTYYKYKRELTETQ